jgi:hypothetical protein
MIGGVLTLFKTLIEIILLRKGPNHIPHSTLLLLVVAGIWLFVGIAAVMVIETYKSSSLLIDLVLAIAGLGFYALLVNSFGHRSRLVRCFTALLGCSIVFSVVIYAGRLVLPLWITPGETELAVQLIWLWSIPVEGHIIARTIDRQWVIGFLIALAVLFAQLQLYGVLKPMLGPAA